MTDPQSPDGFRPPAPPPTASETREYQAPTGAYQAPTGGYATVTGSYAPPAPAVANGRGTGMLALLLSLIATVVTPILGGLASWEVGRRIPGTLMDVASSSLDALAFLSPAREQVLWAELAFWSGTVIGIAAFILGVIAIVKRRGRGQGIAALIVTVLGPVVFFTIVGIALSIGAAVGSASLSGI